jgi:hypothetical protein
MSRGRADYIASPSAHDPEASILASSACNAFATGHCLGTLRTRLWVTLWQEDRASPMVSPIKSHPKEKPKWHIRCTTRL